MSDVIRLLPESIANQIAAGEVVESPASAVKELLENAVDAGATSIQLEVLDGGQTLIHVIDNGVGMSPADARMAFEKHATSKIRETDDLFKLTTMGFRGEALAAISAISRIELRTRRADHELGTLMRLSGSEVLSSEACVSPIGTAFKVQDLFYNTPARRNFLYKPSTENGRILREFIRVALVNPSIAMKLTSEGKLVKDLPAVGLKERVLAIAGSNFKKKLLNIQFEGPFVNIQGYVAPPSEALKEKPKRYLFVNGRYIEHYPFQRAIESAYEGLVAEGKHASFFVYLSVPTESIEVNLNPTKTKVRFLNEQMIASLLHQLVREALSANVAIPVIDFDNPQTEIPAYERHSNIDYSLERPSNQSGYMRRVFMGGGNSSIANSAASASSRTSATRGHNHASSYDIDWNSLQESFNQQTSEVSLFSEEMTSSEDSALTSPTALLTHGVFSGGELSSLGQLIYKGRYIVTSLRRNLTLIDYQRAQTRILYERYMLELSEGRVEVGNALFPESLELSLEEDQMLELLSEDFRALGFSLVSEEEGRYIVSQAPVAVLSSAHTLLKQVLVHCVETGEHEKDYLQRSIALAMAEASARASGVRLTQSDIDSLLAQLFATSDPNLCPRGCTIMTHFTEDEIERRFS